MIWNRFRKKKESQIQFRIEVLEDFPPRLRVLFAAGSYPWRIIEEVEQKGLAAGDTITLTMGPNKPDDAVTVKPPIAYGLRVEE